MQIDVWSDLVCPFCYIGKRHLETAIAELGVQDQVTIRWHSFELDPQADQEAKPVIETLMAKYRMSREQTLVMMQRVIDMGEAAGLNLKLESALRVNTLMPHRLLHLAARYHLQDASVERLMRAYFCEGENIGNPETLERLLDEIGLDQNAVRAALDSEAYLEQVRADQRQAHELGVTGVPYFLIDHQVAISGAQPVHVLSEALARCLPDAVAPLEQTGDPESQSVSPVG
ncbi:MAG: disulfide bond formation protein DsbA [Candidatus Melainabacteria bacterium HGW-Melainabacteria-1]|nr:MAG: disulfide bond formation protein DsbA [Candidatus Melainabacteria bacterium HGW-Melainabacteria-1]